MPRRNPTRQQTPLPISRWWAGVIVLLCGLTVIWLRLLQIQLVEGRNWSGRATQNRLYGALTAPGRGIIFDRYDEPLVFNEPEYVQLLDKKALFGPTRLVSNDEGLALLATDSGSVRQTFHRMYPIGPALAHVLGYVTPVTADELEHNHEVSAYDQTGKQGIEQFYDRQLRGDPGEEQYEITALGLKRRLVKKTAPGNGAPIQTTLDPYLSVVSDQALGDNRGAVVILDAKTGAVLSLVSAPSFDPNWFTVRTSDEPDMVRRQSVRDLFTDDGQPLFNRAVSGAYPPGSIFKLVTALAALQSGQVTTETEVVDEGVLKVGDFSYANWYFTQYGRTEGPIALRRAIARSNDIYFYKAAESAGAERIAAMARGLGLGQPTGIELRSQQAGLVPDPQWKEAVKGERWYLGNTYHYGIGQGDLQVTPIQMAQLVQALVNRSAKCQVHLNRGTRLSCENVGLSDDHLEAVLSGMLDACTAGGTAYPFFPWNQAHQTTGVTSLERLAAGQVACKTGTAEFGGADGRGFKKTHGWFVMTLKTENLVGDQVKLLGNTTNASTMPSTAASSINTGVGTASAALAGGAASPSAAITTRSLPLYLDKSRWLAEVTAKGFPEQLVIVVLVESDDQRPYREGSRDAAPVAKKIVDWMVH